MPRSAGNPCRLSWQSDHQASAGDAGDLVLEQPDQDGHDLRVHERGRGLGRGAAEHGLGRIEVGSDLLSRAFVRLRVFAGSQTLDLGQAEPLEPGCLAQAIDDERQPRRLAAASDAAEHGGEERWTDVRASELEVDRGPGFPPEQTRDGPLEGGDVRAPGVAAQRTPCVNQELGQLGSAADTTEHSDGQEVAAAPSVFDEEVGQRVARRAQGRLRQELKHELTLDFAHGLRARAVRSGDPLFVEHPNELGAMRACLPFELRRQGGRIGGRGIALTPEHRDDAIEFRRTGRMVGRLRERTEQCADDGQQRQAGEGGAETQRGVHGDDGRVEASVESCRRTFLSL